jgi:hypothetical protein
MTDLGFGLADRRTVMAILFVLLLSTYLLGNPIPVDSSGVVPLLSSLLFLTAYLFALRTIARLGIALCYALLRIPLAVTAAVRAKWPDKGEPMLHPDDTPGSHPRPLASLLGPVERLIRSAFKLLGETFHDGVYLPLVATRDWTWKEHRYFRHLPFLGIFDRLVLLGIAYSATLPSLESVRYPIALSGVAGLPVVFVITGRYSLFVKDAFQKTEEDHAELVVAATNPNISFPRVIATRPDTSGFGP